MIPKIIHYCWFGGKRKPRSVKRCIDSWKCCMPDWEIKEWGEDNCDIASVPYAREAYECKKWAFVSDYFRLKALRDWGGISRY